MSGQRSPCCVRVSWRQSSDTAEPDVLICLVVLVSIINIAAVPLLTGNLHAVLGRGRGKASVALMLAAILLLLYSVIWSRLQVLLSLSPSVILVVVVKLIIQINWRLHMPGSAQSHIASGTNTFCLHPSTYSALCSCNLILSLACIQDAA